MKNNLVIDNTKILEDYYERINELIINSRKRLKKNIDYEMVKVYYEIGHIIDELIEKYHLEASQNEIIKQFSEKLTNKFGQGFSVPSLKKMKKFY